MNENYLEETYFPNLESASPETKREYVLAIFLRREIAYQIMSFGHISKEEMLENIAEEGKLEEVGISVNEASILIDRYNLYEGTYEFYLHSLEHAFDEEER